MAQVKHGDVDHSRGFHGVENAVQMVRHQQLSVYSSMRTTDSGVAAKQADATIDYLDALDDLVDGCHLRNQVGLKNALGYDRYLDFDEPDEPLARQAWDKSSKSAQKKAEQKPARAAATKQ